jgi:N-acetyl-gamma-glutamyl-phosphate reductase
MTKTYRVGLIGARGYAGAELLRLIAGHPHLTLAFASSRELVGKRVSEICPAFAGDLEFESLLPDQAARRGADAVFLALPDGAGASLVEEIERASPNAVIVDLSADHRFDDWVYGLPELHRAKIKGAKRIANPGCYATALQLAVAPLLGNLSGPPSVFGVSGYSGAGTSPSPRNDPKRLKDNLMPYKLVGHNHEREATRHLGTPVRFTPHVHPAFRGLVVTTHLQLKAPLKPDALKALYAAAFKDEPLVRIVDEPPELKDAAGIPGVVIGGFAAGESHAVVVAALDNLLKGAAVQAMQNLNLALGLEEYSGIFIPALRPS